MHGAVKVILGLLLIIVGIYSYVRWEFFWVQLKDLFWLVVGNWGLWVALVGLIFLFLGASDLRE